jgi:DNA replication protein DnaC
MIKNPLDTALEKHLDYLKLAYLKENCRPFAAEGNAKHWSHIDYLARLIEGEAAARHDRTILHRIKAARFPLIKTLESFRWDWPKKINQLQIQDLFRLRFIDEKANAIFLAHV